MSDPSVETWHQGPSPTPRLDLPPELESREAWREGQLGRYQDVRVLARGGMGVILRGFDPAAEREVAIKVIDGDGGDATQRARFLAEGKITAQLQHPCIVPVYEVGQLPGGELFFAMKLVHGQPLTERLSEVASADSAAQQRALPRLLEIFGKICDAVAYAHSRGVIHRDLKPDNVMLGEFGEVLVMDWGLVRAAVGGTIDRMGREEDAAGSASTTVTRARRDHGVAGGTLDGTVLGTPAYMPPEQALGCVDQLDDRADVYSLGAILYHVLTGLPPFINPNVLELLDQVAAGELVPPMQRAPQRRVPSELQAACLRAMALEPNARYATVADFRADIDAYLAGRELSAVQYSWARRIVRFAWRQRVALIVLMIGASAIGLVALQRSNVRKLSFRAALDEATRHQSQAVKPADLPLDPISAQPLRGPWQTALEHYINATSALNRARRLMPDDGKVSARRRVVGRALGETALLGRDYGLARQAFADLLQHGLSQTKVDQLIRRVESLRDRRAIARNERLRAILDDIGRGLDRPGRPAAALGRADYLFEVVSYKDPATVAALSQPLERLAHRPAPRAWSPREIQLGLFCCEALGRLGLPEAVDALARFAPAASQNYQLAVCVGQALCHTGREQAFEPLLNLMVLIGINSAAWEAVESLCARVPEPANHLSGRDESYLVKVGLLRQRQGRFADAKRLYDAMIDASPAGFAHLANRANLLVRIGDLDGALRDCNAALKIAPDHAPMLCNRAIVYIRQGRLDLGRADLDHALRIEPDNAEGLNNRAMVHRRQGRFEEALSDLARAIALRPKSVKFYVGRSLIQTDLGLTREAMLGLDRALEIDPTHVKARVERAELRRKASDKHGALSDLDIAVEHAGADRGRKTHALTNRSQLHRELGRLDAAMSDAQLALSLSPDHPMAHYALVCVRIAQGRIKESLVELNAAIRRSPSAASLRQVRGQVLMLRRDFEGASSDLGMALKAEPDNPRFLQAHSQLCQATGDWIGALRDLDRLVVISPGWSVYCERAAVRFRLGQSEQALDDYGQALRRVLDARQLARIYCHRARLFTWLGRIDDAEQDIKRALDRAPSHWESQVIEATLPYYRGQLAKALASLDRLVRLRPDAVDARLARASIAVSAGQPAKAQKDLDLIVDKIKGREIEQAYALRVRLKLPQDKAGALRECDAWIARSPASPVALAKRGQLRLEADDMAGARADLDAALKIRPDYHVALMARGALRAHGGDLQGGMVDLNLALKVSKGAWDVHYNIGLVLSRAGKRAAAIQAFRKAKIGAPNGLKARVQAAIDQLGG